MSHNLADVIVIQKQSALERHGTTHADFSSYLAHNPEILKLYSQAHNEHIASRQIIISELTKAGVNFKIYTIDELFLLSQITFYNPHDPRSGLAPFKGIVISLGGDGTLLHASHYCGNDTILLGINSCPSTSVGHLCAIKPNRFANILPKLLNKATPFTTVRRLCMQTQKVQLPLALNDILFCNMHPAATSRYQISMMQNAETIITEQHNSSGVWISTATGSTAAISSYNLPVLPINSHNFLFATRELYRPPHQHFQLLGSTLNGDTNSLVFFSRMRQGLVCIDGSDSVFSPSFGDTIQVSLPREASLRIILPEQML